MVFEGGMDTSFLETAGRWTLWVSCVEENVQNSPLGE